MKAALARTLRRAECTAPVNVIYGYAGWRLGEEKDGCPGPQLRRQPAEESVQLRGLGLPLLRSLALVHGQLLRFEVPAAPPEVQELLSA